MSTFLTCLGILLTIVVIFLTIWLLIKVGGKLFALIFDLFDLLD